MKLVTFSTVQDSTPRVGLLDGNDVVPYRQTYSMLDVILASEPLQQSDERLPLDVVQIHEPLKPGKIIAIGRNYADHAKEMANETPDHPLIFSIFPSAVVGPGQPIQWRQSISQEVDWEGELAVVVGKQARDLAEADAMHAVFGYTLANDVSARDLQKRIDKQWTRAKSLDTFCPLGPALVTADEVPDPQALTITTTVNDDVVQHGHTADMIFSVAFLVSYCSQMFTLEPGDLILTGTPDGVGAGRTPPVFLKDGDRVSITIDVIGTLTNPCEVMD